MEEKKEFENLLVVMNRRRAGGETTQTREALRKVLELGAMLVTVDGISCLPLARNTALSSALRVHVAKPELIHLLVLDDDVAFELSHVRACIASAEHKTPAACLYITEDNRWAGVRCTPNRWLVGLGFVLFRFSTIVELSKRSVRFPTDQHPDGVWEFTQARTVYGAWHSDDYYLLRRLGGAKVVGFVGHVKPVALLPTEADMVEALGVNDKGPFFSTPKPNDAVLELL